MLHTKYRGHRPSGSGEKNNKVFYHIWAWRLSWSYDQDHLNKFLFPCPKESPYEILSLIGPVVSKEKMFENVDGRTDGRRSIWYTFSSPMSR